MTGKDLIIYILQNDLLDEDIGDIINNAYMTADEAAAKFDVGPETIRAWYLLWSYLDGATFGNTMYIRRNQEDPRNKYIEGEKK